MDEQVKWFFNLPDTQKQIFLTLLSYSLTIHGRLFGLDLAGEKQSRAFQGLNELQHQISQHIGHLFANDARYPDDVFWKILQEKSDMYGISNNLASSIKSARKKM